MGWGGTHGRGPLGAQRARMGDPWEWEPLGAEKDRMGGGPGPPMGWGPLGAQKIPWEGTLGAPIGIPFKGILVMKLPSKTDENHENLVF